MNFGFEKELTIRFSETDNRGQMKIVSIFDCFQDVSCEHAELMGIAATDLLTKNYTWVMLKYNIDILRAPFWNEEIKIKTWRYPHKNLYELRRFDLIDKKGELIIKGLSAWVMMDFNSRKPVRLSRFIGNELMEVQPPIENNFIKIPKIQSTAFEKNFNVRMQDIDFNNHVNNSVYIGWAVESIPEEIFLNYKLSHVDVNYINEISYGNKIVSKVEPDNGTVSPAFLHSISGGDKAELTRLKTIWEPI